MNSRHITLPSSRQQRRSTALPKRLQQGPRFNFRREDPIAGVRRCGCWVQPAKPVVRRVSSMTFAVVSCNPRSAPDQDRGENPVAIVPDLTVTGELDRWVKKGGRRFDGRCLNHTKNRTKSSQDWRSPQVTRVDEIGEISLGVPRTAHGSGSRPVTSARKRLGEATNGAANRKRQALKNVINQYLRSSFQVSLAPVGSEQHSCCTRCDCIVLVCCDKSTGNCPAGQQTAQQTTKV